MRAAHFAQIHRLFICGLIITVLRARVNSVSPNPRPSRHLPTLDNFPRLCHNISCSTEVKRGGQKSASTVFPFFEKRNDDHEGVGMPFWKKGRSAPFLSGKPKTIKGA
ncbi:MAG: hypothetical protein ACLVB5_13195 [Christensenellales bacterium]